MSESEKQLKSTPLPDPQEPDDILDEELDRMLEGVPQEAKSKIRSIMSMTMVTQRTSPQAELMRKMTPENIHEFIQTQDASDQRTYKDRQNTRIAMLIAFGLGICALLGVIALLKSNGELLEKVLPPVITLIAGAIGGYGLGRKNNSSND